MSRGFMLLRRRACVRVILLFDSSNVVLSCVEITKIHICLTKFRAVRGRAASCLSVCDSAVAWMLLWEVTGSLCPRGLITAHTRVPCWEAACPLVEGTSA